MRASILLLATLLLLPVTNSGAQCAVDQDQALAIAQAFLSTAGWPYGSYEHRVTADTVNHQPCWNVEFAEPEPSPYTGQGFVARCVAYVEVAKETGDVVGAGEEAPLPPDESEHAISEDAARQVAEQYYQQLAGSTGCVFHEQENQGDTWSFLWQRLCGGIPYRGDGVFLELSLSGRLRGYSMGMSMPTPASTTVTLTQQQAESAARAAALAAGYEEDSLELQPGTALAIVPWNDSMDPDAPTAACWIVDLFACEVDVEAATGEIAALIGDMGTAPTGGNSPGPSHRSSVPSAASWAIAALPAVVVVIWARRRQLRRRNDGQLVQTGDERVGEPDSNAGDRPS